MDALNCEPAYVLYIAIDERDIDSRALPSERGFVGLDKLLPAMACRFEHHSHMT